MLWLLSHYRLKVHLGDTLQGSKSPFRPGKRHSHQSLVISLAAFLPLFFIYFYGISDEILQKEEEALGSVLAASGSSDEAGYHGSSGFEYSASNSENWMVVSTSGEIPAARFGVCSWVKGLDSI